MTEQASLLLQNLDRSFRGASWHGPTLLGSLRDVNLEEAAWRPQPDRHNIWELVVHAAYWKYRVCAVLEDLPRGSFDLKGNNFFPRPLALSKEAWETDLHLVEKWHDELRSAVAAFDPARLGEHPGKGQFTFLDHIVGAGAHDAYHAGQIQLLKRLYRNRTEPATPADSRRQSD